MTDYAYPMSDAHPDAYTRGLAQPGLTKREWFAGMALCGLAGSDVFREKVSMAVQMADRLIKELKETENAVQKQS